MEGIQGLISRIRSFCDSHGVDIEQELSSYDRKGTGVISPVSLQRWISSLSLNFSTQQIQKLANAFRRGEGVDWRSLQFNIENSKQPQDTQGASRPPQQCVVELRKLGGMLSIRQQTLRELLRPYDTSNRGKVTSNQFYRAFGLSDMTKQLVKYYADTVTGFIDYMQMYSDIQSLSNETVDPDAPITEVPDCFEILARYIKSRSIDLYRIFRHADTANTGKLTENQFINTLASIQAPLSPVDIRDITRVFLDDEKGYASYKQFIASVDVFKPRPSEKVLTATRKSEELQVKVDVDEVMADVKSIIKQRRINVNDYFATLPSEGYEDSIPARLFSQIIASMHLSLQADEMAAIADMFPAGQRGMVDYKAFINAVVPHVTSQTVNCSDVIDRLKKYISQYYTTFAESASRYDREGSGEISCNQLISSLQFIGFELTNQEVMAIYQTYPGKSRGSIAWMDLAKDVDPEQGSMRMRTSRKFQEDEVERTRSSMRAKPSPAVCNILLAIQNAVKRFNIDLERQFASYDRYRKGYLNNSGFEDVILSLRANINQMDIRAISQFYRISGTPDINYGNFIEDVLSAQPIVEEKVESYPTQEAPLPSISPSVHNFIRRFKSFVQMRRISVNDVFRPYDNMNNGTVQVFKVPPAFNNIQFTAMRAELEDLISTFRDQRKKELFNYILFERAVESEDINSEEARAGLSGAPLSAELNRDALTTCLQIHERLRSRRRRVANIFAGIQTETIPVREFQRRLDDINMVLRAGQVTALCRKYRVGLTEEIRWRDFCNDVENSRTIGGEF